MAAGGIRSNVVYTRRRDIKLQNEAIFQRHSFFKNNHYLALSDCHLLGFLQNALRGRRFAVFFQEQSIFSTHRLLSFGSLKEALRGRRFAVFFQEQSLFSTHRLLSFGSLKDALRGRRFAVFFQEQSLFSTHRLLSFGSLKDALRGRRFADDDELKRNVRGELRRFS